MPIGMWGTKISQRTALDTSTSPCTALDYLGLVVRQDTDSSTTDVGNRPADVLTARERDFPGRFKRL